MGNWNRFRSLPALFSGVLLTLGLFSCGLLNPDSDDTDRVDPVITLKGDDPDTVYAGVEYDDPGYTAVDNEDGTITSSVNVDYGTLDTDGPVPVRSAATT